MALAVGMILFGATVDTPRFYGWAGLAAAVYVGYFTLHGARTGVYWSRNGPVERGQGRQYVIYLVLSAVLTLSALALGVHGFVFP